MLIIDDFIAEKRYKSENGLLLAIRQIFKRRWKVEEHHRVLQSNLDYTKAPIHTLVTLVNHCFVCLYAFFDQQKLIKKNEDKSLSTQKSIIYQLPQKSISRNCWFKK